MLIGVVSVLAALGLLIYAAIDCVQTPAADVGGPSKALWLSGIVLVPVAGPLAWLLAGRPHRARHQRGPRPEPGTRPLGPDDDPDFLARLREEQHRHRPRPHPPADPDGSTP